jgi:hypothetical protein
MIQFALDWVLNSLTCLLNGRERERHSSILDPRRPHTLEPKYNGSYLIGLDWVDSFHLKCKYKSLHLQYRYKYKYKYKHRSDGRWGPFFGSRDGRLKTQDSSTVRESSFGILLGFDCILLLLSRPLTPSTVQMSKSKYSSDGVHSSVRMVVSRLYKSQSSFGILLGFDSTWIRFYLDCSTLQLQLLRLWSKWLGANSGSNARFDAIERQGHVTLLRGNHEVRKIAGLWIWIWMDG